ncbi:MAG: transporter [Polaromonas sp.]|nr:transporter [Polaromonas sp.]
MTPPMTLAAAAPTPTAPAGLLDRKTGAIVFLAFAAAYFCSALVRAITATLSPVLTQEFSLHARDLGLLAGGYFLGFAAIQLPLGRWLDRHGPKRIILCFLSLAVLGCLAFSVANSFAWLLASRMLVGMGVGACLMAPLTGYRRWFDAATQLRANSWMLMSGSLGMLSSTLPVQWLVPMTGWRPLFWILAALILLAMGGIAWVTPGWRSAAPPASASAGPAAGSYAEVWRNRYFHKMLLIGFFNYGGMVAMQTLWAGPWMIRVAGYTPLQAATGLFCLNATMLATFWCWGMFNPRLVRAGWSAERLITRLAPVSLLVLAFNVVGGSAIGWLGWALFCMTTSVVSLAQPAVGMAFRPELAGRALSAYNLVVFAGVFVVQWGIGLLVDAFGASGLTVAGSFQAAMGVYLCCCIASYAYFLSVKADNSAQ